MAKRSRPIFFSILLILAGVVAGVGYIGNRLAHHGEGARHTFPLAGISILSDEQALSFAKQTLILDKRFSEKMELDLAGNGTPVNRGNDQSYVSLSWSHPGTHDRWYVQLHRTPEQVDAVSYPGK